MRVFSLIVVLFITTSALFSQQLRVTGRVTSSSDATYITGATVQVKNTGTTAITDAYGSYTISAPQGATLVFTFVGFEPFEAIVRGQQAVNA
ncbi:MAG: carboxypeptidase-like regulatory domain-containing protein, partial [Segetibacter sp.]